MHGPLIGLVVYVVPCNVPPHVPPTVATNPSDGVIVKITVAPGSAVATVEGLIVPFAPALGVTAYVVHAVDGHGEPKYSQIYDVSVIGPP